MSADFANIVRPFPWQCTGCGHHELGHAKQGPCVDYGDCPCTQFKAVDGT